MHNRETSTIEERVFAIVTRIARVPRDRVTRETNLRVELNIDSLSGLRVISEIEEEFDIRVPDDELDVYGSVALIVDAIERQLTLGSK